MNSAERIELVLSEQNTNARRMSLELGFSESYIPAIAGGNKPISKKIAEAIHKKYGYSIEWLLFGIGSKKPIPANNLSMVVEDDYEYVILPYAPVPLRAGIIEMSDPEANYGNLSRIKVRIKKGEEVKDNVVFEVNGDSMEPQLASGSQVRCKWIDPGNWEYLSSGVYAVSYAHSFVIKRVKNNDLISKGYLTLHSDNVLTGGSINVPVDQIRHIWKVIRIIDSPVF
ncbi:S24 family peptidase [Larkinella ripae]